MTLLSLFQKASTLFTEEDKKELSGPIEEYDMTEESTFLDIGSGFGKPVFHASMQASKLYFS